MVLMDEFKHKIRTAEEIKEAIGGHPREKKVVMCHGVFDVVHPGHIRHLLYAKSKADILIASLTADKHINKGVHRPHVPQELRAMNLAAFEMVDYVIIDPNAKPLDNIKVIQPDLFAKGYEYVSSGKPAKTIEEEDALQSYGGEILFTPGDVVYSSSQLITNNPPALKVEKLISLMGKKGISLSDIKLSLSQMPEIKVHIIGDTIVDSYTQTTMIGGQTKTPTMSVRYEAEEKYVGGAGIVAKHLKAAGANVTFTTVLGEDELKDFVVDNLEASGVQINAIIDSTRPTTHKNAIVASGYRLLKIDTLDNSSITDLYLNQIEKLIRTTPADIVIFSDFRHGIYNKRTIPTLVKAIPPGVFKVADSQVASRWGNITEFQGFDLITPNEREARFALADQDSGIRPLAANLYDAAKCKTLILKLGEKGLITCCHDNHESLDSFFVLDHFVDKLVDAVGSGDALLAYSSLALSKGCDPVIASVLGAIAAACECEKDGNMPITPEAIRGKLHSLEKEISFGQELESYQEKSLETFA